MTVAFVTQIELDPAGIAWIAGTKVKVTEVVLDKLANGWNPEEIHSQHPNLSQIKQRLSEADELSAQVSDAEFRRKLNGLKRSA